MTSALEKLTVLYSNHGPRISALFKASIGLLGQQQLTSLIINRAMFTLLCHVLFLLSCGMMSFDWHRGWGIFLMVVMVLGVYPYSLFYHMRMRAKQTWFSYAAITGHPNPLEEANTMIIQQKWRLRLMAIVDLALRNVVSDDNLPFSIWRIFASMVIMSLDGMYEIAQSYLLPAVVIERLSLVKAASKLKQLRNNIPDTLAGTWGVDIAGDAAGGLLWIAILGLLAVAGIVGWALPNEALVSPEYVLHMGDISFFYFPGICAVVLISLFSKLIRVLTTSLQATYFAIFYTRINHPEKITPEMQEKIDGYLTAMKLSKDMPQIA